VQGDAVVIFPPADSASSATREVWTRRFGDEYLAGYTTPLTQTLLLPWIAEDYLRDMARLMGRKDLIDLQPIRRYQGYQYFSGEYMARFLRALPRRMRAAHTQSWFTPGWEQRVLEEPFEPRRLLQAMLAPFRDPRGRIDRNLVALERHCARVEREVAPLLAQDYAALTDRELCAQLTAARELGREHFRVIRWGMGFYNPALHAALRVLLERWAGDAEGDLYQALVSGLPDTLTAAINRGVWQLSISAREDAQLCAALLEGGGCDELRSAAPDALFWTRFDAFQARYGHRGGTREICEPRWAESPDTVLAFVRAQLRSREPGPDPGETEARAAARRELVEMEVAERLRRRPGGRARGIVLTWFRRYTQAYTRYRENQRHYLDFITAHLRRLVLEQGARLVRAGTLDDAAQVFFLELPELLQLQTGHPGPAQLRARIDERRQHYLAWKDRLPATYLFDDVETEGEVGDGEQLANRDREAARGVAASRGIGRGPVHVVEKMHDLGTVVAGEVLVVSNIDPGWTSVFPLLAGLITETGGTLSHGAILAREYGIPCVMGVARATERLTDGQMVEVDGTVGRVRAARQG